MTSFTSPGGAVRCRVASHQPVAAAAVITAKTAMPTRTLARLMTPLRSSAPNDPAQQPAPPKWATRPQNRCGGAGLLQRLVRRAFAAAGGLPIRAVAHGGVE